LRDHFKNYKMQKLDFLFVGFDKSGSTWLHKNLMSHPQVYVPKEKDLYFFDRYYSRGLKWYHSFFKKGFNDSKIKSIGELSHDYIYSEKAAKRIKEYNPNIKIIITFRDPIDRYLSLLNFSIMKGSITKFEASNINRHPEIISRAIVSNYIKKYLEIFEEKNILLLDYVDLKNNPKFFLQSFYKFICVDNFFDSNLINKKINKTKSHRFFLLNWFIFRLGKLARFFGFNSLIAQVRGNKFINTLLYKKNKNNIVNLDTVDEKFLIKLTEDYNKIKEMKNSKNEEY